MRRDATRRDALRARLCSSNVSRGVLFLFYFFFFSSSIWNGAKFSLDIKRIPSYTPPLEPRLETKFIFLVPHRQGCYPVFLQLPRFTVKSLSTLSSFIFNFNFNCRLAVWEISFNNVCNITAMFRLYLLRLSTIIWFKYQSMLTLDFTFLIPRSMLLYFTHLYFMPNVVQIKVSIM